MMDTGYYHASLTTDDVWICYPWEAQYVLSLSGFELIFDVWLLTCTGTSTNMTGCPRRIRSLSYTSCYY